MYNTKESRSEFVTNWYRTIGNWQAELRKARR
jgi:DNA phosphorothioation-dependent restriction protein DptG